MSCYAFFKRWLLLGLLARCDNKKSLYPLNNDLLTLAYNKGCFPLDLGPFHPKSACYSKLH